jgi:hypothetical protein
MKLMVAILAQCIQPTASHPIYSRFILGLPSLYEVFSSLEELRLKLVWIFRPLHGVLHVLPISYLIWSTYQCLVKGANYETSHYILLSPILGRNILLSILFSDTLSQCSPLRVKYFVLRSYKTAGKIIVLYVVICRIVGRREGKIF